MALLYDNYTIAVTTSLGEYYGGANWHAQTFTVQAGFTITSVKLRLRRDPAAVLSNIVVAIQATTSSLPDGTDLCSGVIDGDALVTAEEGVMTRIEFTTTQALTSDVEYAIVVRAPNATAAGYGRWKSDTGGGYAGGQDAASADSGSNWTADPSDDCEFECYGGQFPADLNYSKKLVAIGNNQIWYESAVGTMAAVTAEATVTVASGIDNSERMTACEAFQKLFIANNTALRVLDLVNKRLSTAQIGTGGVSVPAFGAVLSGQKNGAELIVDFVTASTGSAYIYCYQKDTAAVSNGEVFKDVDSTTSVSFTLDDDAVSSPHIYTMTVYANSSDYGALPRKLTLCCLYRGRLVWAGNPDLPHQWYMSRQAQPYDYAYSANDAQSPVAGGNADAGKLGDIITCLIPIGDDYLIFGCANSVWLLRGDPAEGGTLDDVSRNTGIFGPHSWCKGDDGKIYFVGMNGLYVMESPTFKPQLLSGGVLPKLTLDWELDPSIHKVSLGYDRDNLGIIICKTSLVSGSHSNYFYSLQLNGFYPESSDNELGIFSQYFYDTPDDSYRRLLVGCNNGYIYYYDTSLKYDAATTNVAIESYCLCPIQPMGEDGDKEGRLNSLAIVCAGGASGGSFSDSDSVVLEVFVADDAETLLENVKDGSSALISVVVTGGGRSSKTRTKANGAYIGVKCSNTIVDSTWAVEKITGQINSKGRIR